MLDVIEAPNNLGLRPLREGVEPGTWKAPAVFERAGLYDRLRVARRARLARPAYSASAQRGTRIRNGNSLRAFSLALAAEVETSLERGALPLVVGGDCSIILGCLLALRRTGGRGLVHIDGHSDFYHPGNYDASARLGSAAGMDLALATGRGEALLTAWPDVSGPLVADLDAIQIGERERGAPDYDREIEDTAITQITTQQWKLDGVAAVLERAHAHFEQRAIDRAWVHIDLDVLDETVMPAVDSPGTPGVTYAELGALVRGLLDSGRVAGMDIAIYDPDLDPRRTHAANIVEWLGATLDGV